MVTSRISFSAARGLLNDAEVSFSTYFSLFIWHHSCKPKTSPTPSLPTIPLCPRKDLTLFGSQENHPDWSHIKIIQNIKYASQKAALFAASSNVEIDIKQKQKCWEAAHSSEEAQGIYEQKYLHKRLYNLL